MKILKHYATILMAFSAVLPGLLAGDFRNGIAEQSSAEELDNQPPTITAIADQVVLRDGQVGPIAFTVDDDTTEPSFIWIEKASTNTDFIPYANILVGGNGRERFVTIKPAFNKEGSSKITITVRDKDGKSASIVFHVSTPDHEPPPTLSPIANTTVLKDSNTGPILFRVSGGEWSAKPLQVIVSSSNTPLIPEDSIFVEGSGEQRFMIIRPAPGKTGTAIITVHVVDAGGKSAASSFTLTVVPGGPPLLSSIADQVTYKDKPTAPILFTTAGGNAKVTLHSSNTALVNITNIVMRGTGANRTLTITPSSNRAGVTLITVEVTSEGFTERTSFRLSVKSANGDFNDDGNSDIFFRHNDGFLGVWFMNGAESLSAQYLNPSSLGDLNYSIVGMGDFDNDHRQDILFQHRDGNLAVWMMDGTFQKSAQRLNPNHPGSAAWKAVGTGDLDSDGNLEIIFQHADGTVAAWHMIGTNAVGAVLLPSLSPADDQWRVVGVGDLTGDGRDELVFQTTDGLIAVMLYTSNRAALGLVLEQPHPGDARWRVAAVGDYDGDLKADLLFQHENGTLGVWFMDRGRIRSAQLLNPAHPGAPSWRVAGFR